MRVATDGALTVVEHGPTAGNELRTDGRRRTWIVRVGETPAHATLQAFAFAFSGLSVQDLGNGVLGVDDTEYGSVRFHSDGRIEAEGRTLDPSTWTIAGHEALLEAETRPRPGRE